MDLPGRPKETGALIRTHTRCLALLREKNDEQSRRLLALYEKPVRRAIRLARPARWGLLWLFTGGEGKRRAVSACNYLWDCALLGLGPAAQELFQ